MFSTVRADLAAAVIPLFFAGVMLVPAGPSAASASVSTEELVTRATESLRAEYAVLVSGTVPARPLIARTNEFGLARSPLQRLSDVQQRRTINARYGLAFTDARVALLESSVEVTGTEARLHTTEQIVLAFIGSQYAHDPNRDWTESRIGHTFVFQTAGSQWTLVGDEVERMPTNSNPEPHSPYPTAQIEPRSARAASLGRLAAPLTSGYYDWSAARSYAAQYALSPNGSYRFFTNDDCTNFVSQVMRAGGWVDRLGYYQDWNNWWYNFGNQTRTWTYTNAFQYFFANSGRGQFLSYLTDLWIGDVIQVDFTNDGPIDHSMVIDDKIYSGTSGIFVSYHTTNTYHKPLSDFLAIYPIPPAAYWAEHVIGTTP